MANLEKIREDLKSYGIEDVKEIVYNPSYDYLFEEELKKHGIEMEAEMKKHELESAYNRGKTDMAIQILLDKNK